MDANGRLTPEAGGVRILAYQPKDRHAYYCKVQFTINGDQDLEVDGFLDITSGFLDLMITDLMRCLPDWAEVQQQD